jgi:hypothetical protein
MDNRCNNFPLIENKILNICMMVYNKKKLHIDEEGNIEIYTIISIVRDNNNKK